MSVANANDRSHAATSAMFADAFNAGIEGGGVRTGGHA
jgi:hypothetical protein